MLQVDGDGSMPWSAGLGQHAVGLLSLGQLAQHTCSCCLASPWLCFSEVSEHQRSFPLQKPGSRQPCQDTVYRTAVDCYGLQCPSQGIAGRRHRPFKPCTSTLSTLIHVTWPVSFHEGAIQHCVGIPCWKLDDCGPLLSYRG